MIRKLVSMLLEFLRTMVMMFLFVSLVAELERSIYESLFHWYGVFYFSLGAGNLILFLVWYRNRLQFSGWYRHEGQAQLSPLTMRIMLSCAAFFILLPLFITYYIYL